MKLLKLVGDFKRCGINPKIETHLFADWKTMPKHNGLYSIWQDETCVYVGQAGGGEGFRGRLLHHYNKAYAIEHSGTSHSKGWQANRLNEDWAPNTWVIEYFTTERAVHRTYLEGAMMLEFDPLCNDESFEDRQ